MAYTSLFKKDDVRITTPFSSSHKGLDLSRGVVEQPIYLPNRAISGTVWKILPGYTKNGVEYKDAPIIYIKHKDGSGSRYIHSYPKNVKVKVGDTVVAGQQICCTGNSGHSHGDHLHFEWLTKWDDLNTRVDPAPYVINDKTQTPPTTPPDTPNCDEYIKQVNILKEENKGLTEALGTLKGTLEGKEGELKTANDRVKFLEDTLLQREKELNGLQTDYDRILGEKERFESEKLELQKEIDLLKQQNSGWVFRIADIIYKLFRKK